MQKSTSAPTAFLSALALSLAALSHPAAARLVPVEWDAQGHFSRELPVAQGKFVEVCEKLPRQSRIAWSFTAAAPLDFNIHFHEGKKVRFPEKKDRVARHAGTLVAAVDQDYCWMWTNATAADVSLQFTLSRR